MDQSRPHDSASARLALWALYTTLDLSGLSNRLILGLTIVGVLVGLVVTALAIAQRRRRIVAAGSGVRVALPFLAPLLVIGVGAVVAWLTRLNGFSVRTPGAIGGIIRGNDFAGFGVIGDLVLLGAPIIGVGLYLRGLYLTHRADPRHLALAAAFPGRRSFLAARPL